MPQITDAAHSLLERFLAASRGDQFFWVVGGLFLLYCLQAVLSTGLMAASPGSGWRVLGSDGSTPKLAKRTEEQLGQKLRDAGFQHLGSLSHWTLALTYHDFDEWAAPELGMFATVMFSGSKLRLFVCSYFHEGPAVILTANYRGRPNRKGQGFWRQYLEGSSPEGLVAAQQQQVKEYLAGSAGRRAWTDFTFEGKIAAMHGFDSGFGRPALVKNALGRLVLLIYLGFILFDLFTKKHK
jgi:hypothetical protein